MEEPARRGLYARLEEVLGDEYAATLMKYLPSDRADGLATRGDVEAVGHGLGGRIDGLEQRMDRFEQRMDRFEQRMDRFEDRMHEFHGALREQTRTFVIASISTMVALAAAAFTAGALI
jgi:hypothetical protein